ncbi:hypothetical protein ACOZ0S_001816 [Cronobacter dublinensis]
MRWNISEIARRRQPMAVAYRFDIHWKYRQKGRRLSHLARLSLLSLTDVVSPPAPENRATSKNRNSVSTTITFPPFIE